MQLVAEQHTDYKALYEQQSAANKELQLAVASLTHQLHQLQKMIFGSKSERFVPATADAVSAQLSLALDADTITQCKIMDATKVSYIRTKAELTDNTLKAHPGRMKLAEH